MQDTTLLDVININDLTASIVKRIVCLTKRIGVTYFSRVEPNDDALDNIKMGYDDIQEWLEIASLLGDKVIEDMKKTSILLGQFEGSR